MDWLCLDLYFSPGKPTSTPPTQVFLSNCSTYSSYWILLNVLWFDATSRRLTISLIFSLQVANVSHVLQPALSASVQEPKSSQTKAHYCNFQRRGLWNRIAKRKNDCLSVPSYSVVSLSCKAGLSREGHFQRPRGSVYTCVCVWCVPGGSH